MAASGLSALSNVVVLMFENRSFDNIFGNLYPPGYTFGDNTFQGVAPNNTPGTSAPWTEDTSSGKPDWDDEVVTRPNPDPGERFQNVNMQLYGQPFSGKAPSGTAPMSGFVTNYTLQAPIGDLIQSKGSLLNPWPTLPRTRYWSPVSDPGPGGQAVGQDIMHTFSSLQLPVSSALAKQYAVCDEWYCSVPTQTYPNRMYSLCATSWARQLSGDYKEYIDDYDMVALTSPVNSIFQELDTKLGTSQTNWKIYYDSYSISEALLEYVTSGSQLAKYSTFAGDVSSGALPPFTLIEPRYDMGDDKLKNNPNSYHPPYSVLEGEQLLQEVYEQLFTPSKNPNWDSTLLIVTFDEHGGCYDHVPPPAAPLPSAGSYTSASGKTVPANASGPPFDRYGVRVPTILISSQIAPGTIFRQANTASTPTAYLDHTSIIRTVFDWLVPDGNLSLTNRDKNAPSIAPVLTEDVGTNTGVTLGTIDWPAPIVYSKDEVATLQAHNHLAQMNESSKS